MISNPALPPIEINGPGSKTVKVGDNLNVTTADVTEVSTDNAKVLKVSQARSDGSAQFNAGAEVVGAGKAVFTVKTGDGKTYEVNITAAK